MNALLVTKTNRRLAMDKQAIKEICLKHGYKLKPQADGTMDLNAYVYDAFDEVLSRVQCENHIHNYEDPIVQLYFSLLGQQQIYCPKIGLNPQELTSEAIDEMKAKINSLLEDLEMQNILYSDVTYKHLDDEVVEETLGKNRVTCNPSNHTQYEAVQCCSDYPECEHNKKETNDPINPNHYKTQSGVECINVAELFPYSLGNAIKYAWRAGKKDNLKQDLEKCEWYLNRAMANGEDSLLMGCQASALKARRLFAKLDKADLPELNYELVSRIVTGRLEYSLILIDDWLTELENETRAN